MRVLQVSPVFFGAEGILGGGERYPLELAKALAELVPTTLVSFSVQPRRFMLGKLAVHLYRPWWHVHGKRTNPFSLAWLLQIAKVSVVHTHQYRTAASNLAIIVGRALGKGVYVTDEGGGGYHWGERLGLGGWVHAHLALSRFAAETLPDVGKAKTVIYGGVDTSQYQPGGAPVAHRVVCVGRILPHKGQDVLLRAADPHWDVHIAGTVYHEAYFGYLRELAAGKQVTFHLNATNDEIVALFQSAAVAVTPSVLVDAFGKVQPYTELLGLTALEAMACGVPVVASAVGGLTEIVAPGETGYVVPPGEPSELRVAVNRLLADAALRARLGATARQHVEQRFTWRAVAQACLEAYTTS